MLAVKYGPKFLKVQGSLFIKVLYFWLNGLLLLLSNAKIQRSGRQRHVFKQQVLLISGCSWKLLSSMPTWDQQFSILYTIHAVAQSRREKMMIQISKSKPRIFSLMKGWISPGLHSTSFLLFCHPVWCTWWIMSPMATKSMAKMAHLKQSCISSGSCMLCNSSLIRIWWSMRKKILQELREKILSHWWSLVMNELGSIVQ